MATTDAKPVPIKGAAYRVYFPVMDADGDLVTGATGLDSEVSKDAGTFADCTNEATEIATSSGIYYLDLSSTEMNADSVVVIVKTSSSGAKTTPIFLYPQEAGDIPVTVEAMNAGTVTASAIATGAIDADAIAADAITDAKVASDVTIASVTGSVGSVTAAVNVGTIEGTDATDALTSAAEAALVSTDTTVGTIAADVTTLLGRLSAARAGYLDVLAGWTGTLRQALRAMSTKVAGEASSDLTGGSSTYVNTTDALENIKDSVSAGSASAADIAAELGGMGYTVTDTDTVSSTAISKRRGDVWTIPLTDLGALGTWTKLWFTIKTGDTGDADTDAKVQILLTNPTVGTDGLQRLNGAAGTAAQGGIVVDDSATGDITVTVASAATTQLAVRTDYVFDVQILRAAGTTTLAYGTFTVRSDVTRAVS